MALILVSSFLFLTLKSNASASVSGVVAVVVPPKVSLLLLLLLRGDAVSGSENVRNLRNGKIIDICAVY